MAPGAERRSETVLGLRQMPAVPGAPMGGHVSCAGVSRASRSHAQCSLVMRARSRICNADSFNVSDLHKAVDQRQAVKQQPKYSLVSAYWSAGDR